MATIKNKIDFMALISAENCNPNGDPALGGRPRIDLDGYGVITDVCLKRKIRNALQSIGGKLLYQSDGREDDGMHSVQERVNAMKPEDGVTTHEQLCRDYIDNRVFGAVIAYKNKAKAADKKTKAKRAEAESAEADKPEMGETNEGSVSLKVRGAVTIQTAVSVDPIEIYDLQITKSLNGTEADGMSSDRMGMKSMVKFGLYVVKGSINPYLAEKNGMTESDVDLVKKALTMIFENDESSARPAGSMNVERIYWWKHNGKMGHISSANVYRTVKIEKKTGVTEPRHFSDYDVTCTILPGIELDVYMPDSGLWEKIQ